VQNDVATFETGFIEGEHYSSMLKSISEAVQRGWKEKYTKKKFNAPKMFQLRKVNQEKTRKIDQANFKDPDLDEVRQLINIFEANYQNTIRVTEVWFLKKKNIGDGFEEFHYDYKTVKGGKNDVSSTIVVNLGVFHEEDEEEEEEELEEESEDEESDDESVEEGVLFSAASNSPDQPERMMPANKIQILNRELTPDEEHKINLGSNELQKIKNGGCLTSGDICKYFDYLGGQDKQLCKNCPDRKPSLFHSTDFITFDSDGTCKYLKNKRISKIDISEKRNIFIPIHKGHHFTCVVIFLDKKQINYYDSLLATDRTRTGCAHKKEQQEKILRVVMQYLQDEFKKNKNNLFDKNDWSLNLRALQLSSQERRCIKPSAACSDLCRSLRSTKNNFTGCFKYQHVAGHMDKYLLWHQLSLFQQFNCVCDTTAKGAVQRAITAGYISTTTQMLP
jgi:hypothetical protein